MSTRNTKLSPPKNSFRQLRHNYGTNSKRGRKLDNRISFTQGWVDRLSPSGAKREQFYDLKVKGLIVELMSTGSKFYRYRRTIDGKDQKTTIGNAATMSLEEARDASEILSSDLIKGSDFKQNRVDIRNELTLRELADFYFEQYANDRCTTADEMQKDFKRWFKEELDLKLSSITTQWIQVRLNKLNVGGHPARANKARDHIRAIFNWGKKQKLCKENPASDTDGFQKKERERFVMPEEFARLFDAIIEYPDPRLRDLFLICLYTGMRKSNVRAMRWDQLNFALGQWRISGDEMKNKSPLTVQLSSAALEVLQDRRSNRILSPWVFPGGNIQNKLISNSHIKEPKKAWETIRKNAGTPDLNIHDLRRTMGSYMAMDGASAATIMQQLGHKSIVATMRYQRVHNTAVKQAADSAIAKMQQLGNLHSEVG
jgi:integrase